MQIPYEPHNLLVTGGAGFIGANFIRYLLQHEPSITIINLDKLTYAGSLANLQDLKESHRHHFIHGDIKDEQLIIHLLNHYQIDTIVHFAAESHVDKSIAAPDEFIKTNIIGTFTLLKAAEYYWVHTKKYDTTQCRFHHISSDEVYGSLQKGEAPFTEQSKYQPRSPYSATKAAADHLVNAYHATYRLPITLSHCSNNFGPYQHPEKFIPTVIRSCLNKKPIPIYGNGRNIRDWLYVTDHCRAILKIIKQGTVGECYDIGGDNEWENLALAQYICQQMDKLMPHHTSYGELIQFTPDRKGHDFRYAINDLKIKTALGFKPLESFGSGLRKTMRFYIGQGDAHEKNASSQGEKNC